MNDVNQNPSPEPSPFIRSLAEADEAPPIIENSPGRRKKMNESAFVLILIVAVSAGVVLGMRHFGMGPASGAVAAEIDYDLDADRKISVAKYERLIDQLERSVEPVFVPEEELNGRNPFMLLAQQLVTDTGEDASELARKRQEEQERREREQREREMMAAMRALKVQSVIGGRVPLARINDETYRIGDVIDNRFTITSIEGRTVMITADGRAFALSLGGGLVEQN